MKCPAFAMLAKTFISVFVIQIASCSYKGINSNVQSLFSVYEPVHGLDMSRKLLLASDVSFSPLHCALLCQRRHCDYYQYDEETGMCHSYSREDTNSTGSDVSQATVFTLDTDRTELLVRVNNFHNLPYDCSTLK